MHYQVARDGHQGARMRTSDAAFRHVSGWLPGTVLALALLLTGCGEPGSPFGENASDTGQTANGSGETNASNGSGHSDDADDSNGSNASGDSGDSGDGGDEEQVVYEWGLPASDTSVGERHQGAEGSAYIALSSSCAEGAQFLAADLAPTYNFESPRNVLLFAAGLWLCEGDTDGARRFFAEAEVYGTAGLTPDDWAFCVLYQVVRSVLEQRPPEDFRCGDGTAPPFREGVSATGEVLTDDPLTLDVDESVPPPLPEPEPEPEPGPGPEPGPEPEPEPEPEPGPDPDGEVDGDETTETETGPESVPGTGTRSAP